MSKVSRLIEYDRDIMVYEISNDLFPESLNGRFLTRLQLLSNASRTSLDIDVPRPNFELSKGISTILVPQS